MNYRIIPFRFNSISTFENDEKTNVENFLALAENIIGKINLSETNFGFTQVNIRFLLILVGLELLEMFKKP